MVDCVIVGAGTAGCVLAAGLSEDPARQVLVVEAGPAGPDQPGGDRWELPATVCGGRTAPLVRGRILGGSSAINEAGAQRTLASDFTAWAGLGLPSWSWENVVPAYRRLETDHDFGTEPYHGDRGPVPIVRCPRDDLHPLMAGFVEAVVASGHPYSPDMNAPDATGIGPYPRNLRDGRRADTASTHLLPALSRANLAVRTDLTVDHVVVRDSQVVGIRCGTELIEAREVVLAAGAPLTPVLLLRSGIGPADDLRRVGIDPVLDLPGVGADLYDQPGAVIPAAPVAGAVAADAPRTQVVGRVAVPDQPDAVDYYLNLFLGPPPFGGDPIAAVMVGDFAPASRGRVTLSAAGAPVIDHGFYSVDGDLARMRTIVRHAWEISQQPVFGRYLAGFLGVDEDDVADDERLDDFLLRNTFSRLTVTGGARMGPSGDPAAVVDEAGRVHGISGLRVADLSLVPVPLRGPTALDAMMIGEHLRIPSM